MTTPWNETALAISGDFEAPGDPWGNVVGDFDGQGLTCGALGWTFATGNQQALIKILVDTHGDAFVQRLMPTTWRAYLDVCQAKKIAEAMNAVSSWSSGVTVKEPYRRELMSLWGSQEMRKVQVVAAGEIAKSAAIMATDWCNGAPPTLAELCFFFDVAVQNGGMKGLTRIDVEAFIALHGGPIGALKAIWTWLMSLRAPTAGWKDAQRSAAEWSAIFSRCEPRAQQLFVMAYLRAQKSSQAWRVSVMARKGTIALGRGWVESELKDLSKDLGITYAGLTA